MYFKKITGEKCYLSPIDTSDYEKYTEWLNDPEVAIGLSLMPKVIGIQFEKDALNDLVKDGYNFAIIDSKSNELIGNCGFPSTDLRNRHGEVGIFIGNKSYWGKGYGVEALTLLLDFGFNVINLESIHLVAYGFNESAIKCYRKVGFKECGRIRNAYTLAGNKYDQIIMDILSSEFKPNHLKQFINKKLGI
ncbi:GNAT family protein [Hathewaya histolytica]|uniref:N-acetyltransferase GCN5 n=1 Tax=Hathewaya histolytica TaxID=1498 RepID=A0A4U9QX21_HATHI|nr:GNAT family protein [Hathewaya histolytica]VTQ83255.1 N-acetyltransferase GCN5 [Hathewaya histolytica]